MNRWIPVSTLLLVLPLTGCGSGNAPDSTNSGRATLTIQWPDRSRLIPAASNSIQVTFLRGNQNAAQQVIPRPASGNTSTVTFVNLKVGMLTLSGAAFPSTDATGVAQAAGMSPVQIVSGQTANITLTMVSTIDHLELTPSNLSVPVGQTLQVIMTAKDIAGGVVLTTPGKITWASADATRAAVDSNGMLTGVLPTGAAPGPVQITVTETESGKSASAPVTVTSSTTVSVSPMSPTLPVGDPQAFTATVGNAPDLSVTWSLQEPGGGSITPAGAYTAPANPGTYHVVATSNYDNSVSAVATVAVQAGDINAIIK